jgi:hypothetical protein
MGVVMPMMTVAKTPAGFGDHHANDSQSRPLRSSL